MKDRTTPYAALLMLSLTLIAGCGDDSNERISALEKSLAAAKAEAASTRASLVKAEEHSKKLERQVEDLSVTPSALLSRLTGQLAKDDLSDADGTIKQLETRFPQSKELQTALVELRSTRLRVAEKAAQEKRIAEQGFRALQAREWKTDALTITVGKPSFSNTFTFDRYGDSWHYHTADRGHKYITLPISVTAAKGISDPRLPEFAVYYSDGSMLRRIDTMDTRFARWEDYATYLGNYSDTRNDFAKTATIPFSLGAEGTNEDLARRPLYLIATAQGCLNRHYARFNNPPVSYSGLCSGLDYTLSVNDFTSNDPKVKLVRRLD